MPQIDFKTSLKAALTMGLVIVVASLVRDWIWPQQTNRQYLEGLVASTTLETTAKKLTAVQRAANSASAYPGGDEEWNAFEQNLAVCLHRAAGAHLATADPWLDKIADKNSGAVLAARLMTQCSTTKGTGVEFLE